VKIGSEWVHLRTCQECGGTHCCPVASENIDPDHPVRVLSYGRKPHVYRVFFTVDHNARGVNVVHIRRGARRRPTPDELKGDQD
jgi:hypothetical protein